MDWLILKFVQVEYILNFNNILFPLYPFDTHVSKFDKLNNTINMWPIGPHHAKLFAYYFNLILSFYRKCIFEVDGHDFSLWSWLNIANFFKIKLSSNWTNYFILFILQLMLGGNICWKCCHYFAKILFFSFITVIITELFFSYIFVYIQFYFK